MKFYLEKNKQEPENDLNGLPVLATGSLSEGITGNHQTLKLMSQIAHTRKGNVKVRRLAENILDYYDVKSHNHVDEALAIGNYVKEKITYTFDPSGIEQVTDPLTLIDRISQVGTARGDCDDMALLCATLLLSVGIKAYFKVIKYNLKSEGYNHIYVVAYASNLKEKPQRIVLDCIVKDEPIGFENKSKMGLEIAI